MSLPAGYLSIKCAALKVKVLNREQFCSRVNSRLRNRLLKITGSIKLKNTNKNPISYIVGVLQKYWVKGRAKICVWMFQYSHLLFRLPRHNSQFKFNQYFEMRGACVKLEMNSQVSWKLVFVFIVLALGMINFRDGCFSSKRSEFN